MRWSRVLSLAFSFASWFSIPALADPAFYDGFENQARDPDYFATSSNWVVQPTTPVAPTPISDSQGGSLAWGWSPTFGENVSLKRHRVAGENIPGASILDDNAFVPLGLLGGDYWNSAYPIGVVGEFYFGTGDVRPAVTHPWNFNPDGSGAGKADAPLDALTFEMVSKDIPFNANVESVRLVSFLIGGNPGSSDQVSVSVEMQPSCIKGAPITVTGVDVYYGYRGQFANIQTRIANHQPDLTIAQGTPALIQPYVGRGRGDERMTLVVIDLWGRDLKNGGNPRANFCDNGRIRVRDLDAAGHLNVDEIRVGDLPDLPYLSTPFGAQARTSSGDNPPAIYGYADLHTHWMSHLGAGAEPVPSVTPAATRRTLRALTAAMGALAGRPYEPKVVSARDICPAGTSCPALTESPFAASSCSASVCTLSDAERDRLALPLCDGDGGGSGKHQDRGGSLFADTNFRSDSAASQLLASLEVHSGSGDCGIGNECSHNSWGFDYENQRFQLPARPFMSRIHQQMYWKWVKRAWQGGLRILVTDVVHNLPLDLLLNNLWAIENPASDGDGPVEVVVGHGADEQYALQRQVCAVRKLLSPTPIANGGQGAPELNRWAQVVTDPQTARRVIAGGKLAIVLGAELDTTGDLRAKGSPTGWSAEVEFMRRLGIRKITPIHQMDNTLGGAAVFSAFLSIENDAFNLANDMMDGANCTTAQNWPKRTNAAIDTTFGVLNRWLYGLSPYHNNATDTKESDAFDYWQPDVYGHLANGQLSCTLDYNTFLQTEGVTWCNGSTKEDFEPGSSWSKCWSKTHFYDVKPAPNGNPNPLDDVHFDIAEDGESNRGSNDALQRVAMDHLATFVTNNDGYVPSFLNAPEATAPSQQYFTNPLINHGGVVNVRELSSDGRRYLQAMRARGMLVDVEHMSEATRAGALTESIKGTGCEAPPYSDDCLVRAYPVIATHSDLRWSFGDGKASERTLKSTEVQQILQTGGVIGLSTGYELHRNADTPAEAGRDFGGFNDCPGSSKSYAQKMLAYIANGEQAGVLSNYFTSFNGNWFSHPTPRPPHWSAVGVGLGSDFNGFAIQVGARFNPNPGTSCYGQPNMSFNAADDPIQLIRGFQQQSAANAVYYGGAAPLEAAKSVAPGNGIPPQPRLAKLRFDSSLGNDVYVEAPVDVPGFPAPPSDIALQGFDFNVIGMANIGLEPDMLQDMVNGMRSVDPSTFTDMRYQMRYVMRSAEDFIEAWEKSVAWCQRSGSTTCGSANLIAGYDADACDVWASDADSTPTLTDATPSCMARCGRTLNWSDANGSHACRCWINDADDHPDDLCEDFKPWCQWFYNGEDDPDGRVTRGSP